MKIDQIIHSKRRTIALIVDRDGRLIVRAPLRASQKQILLFVEQKRDWIRSKQELASSMYARFLPKKYANGENFLFLGKTYRLVIVEKSDSPLRLADQFILTRAASARGEKVFKGWYAAQARKVIPERVKIYAVTHGFNFLRVNITSAQTRWGSCSPSGSLNFSWRLVMAPMQVIDYVVIHELVHLRQKNHSRHFWDEVKTMMPDYAQQVKWLKTNGHMLRLT